MAVAVHAVGKCYEIYDRPIDRLKQALFHGRRRFYREFWALRDVSVQVRPGEALGILGRNGSGKSTLLQIIAGTLSPTTGSVEVRGRVAALLELGSGFNSEFTGRENVYTNGAILGISRQEMTARLGDILAFADIGEFIDRPVKTYSTGMMLRLAFAVQAQVDPDILIVDEALAVGDERFQRKCFARLDELRQRGTSILLVTHSTPTIETYCERAMLLERGVVHGLDVSKRIIDQYHALLYADERAYLRMVNQAHLNADPGARFGPAPSAQGSADDDAQRPAAPEGVCRALIRHVWMRDARGQDTDVFAVGDQAEIGFEFEVLVGIGALKAGLRIRTIQGIEVYGTSSDYVKQSLSNVPAGSRWLASFKMSMGLCAGTYFVSIAIAEATSRTEMTYLDKRTDVIVFKILEHPLTGTGIAHLGAQVSLMPLTPGQAGC